MNKILFAALNIVIVATITGCSNVDDITDERIAKTLQGELQILPALVSDLDATHVLVTTAKERVYLRSLLFDLDSYDTNQVRVSGQITEQKLNGKPVDLMVVERIDLLSDSIGSDMAEFSSKELGLKFVYDKNKFQLERSTSRVILSDKDTNDVVSVKIYKSSPEVDAISFISKNYSDNYSVNSNLDSYLVFNADNSVIVIDKGQYFYEVLLVGFDGISNSEKQSFALDFVKTFNFIDVENKTLDTNLIEIDNVTIDENVNSNAKIPDDKVENTTVNSKFAKVISDFETQAMSLLPSFKAAISYSFTDNNQFYIVFLDSDSKKLRALFSYNDSNFTKLADFEAGTSTDWILKSGNNSAANKTLTLIMVDKDNGNREISLNPGYRYFESLPLGFGLQYPQSWYYSRSDNSYLFSSKPISEGEINIKADVMTTSFADLGAESVSTNIKKSVSGGNVIYYIALEKGYIKISGSLEYLQQVETMAKSVKSVN